jgi:hypothetical protein
MATSTSGGPPCSCAVPLQPRGLVWKPSTAPAGRFAQEVFRCWSCSSTSSTLRRAARLSRGDIPADGCRLPQGRLNDIPPPRVVPHHGPRCLIHPRPPGHATSRLLQVQGVYELLQAPGCMQMPPQTWPDAPGSRDAKGMRLGMRARDTARHGLPVLDANAPLPVGCNGRRAVRGKISGQDPGGGVALTTGGGWNVEYPSPGRIWRVTSVLAPAVSLLDVPS